MLNAISTKVHDQNTIEETQLPNQNHIISSRDEEKTTSSMVEQKNVKGNREK